MVHVLKTASRNMGKKMKRGENETERAQKDRKRILMLMAKPWVFLL